MGWQRTFTFASEANVDRRDFLDLRRLLGQEPTSSADPVLLRFSRRAMATTFQVLLPMATPHATQSAQAALDLIDQLEDQLTVYRDSSEVSSLNQRAHSAPVEVEPHLFELLMLAKNVHGETEGAFDITASALIKAWGFHMRAGRVPTAAERTAALAQVGMEHVQLDPRGRTVFFDIPGLAINLGSIGKGYALDRVIQLLWKEWRVASVLVHGGLSSIFALEDEPGGEGWPVALSDPRDPGRTLGVFRLQNRGLGTSSATYQHLLHEGRKLGHILDPRTGWPAEGMLSASVTAPTAALADALATAFFILGPGPAAEYCRSHSDVGAVLLADVPDPKPIVLGRAAGEFR